VFVSSATTTLASNKLAIYINNNNK